MKFKPYLISLLATAFPNALGFLLFPLYAKALGASAYGTVALLEAYQGVALILLFSGMTTAFYVFYSHADDEEEQKRVISASVYFSLLILAFIVLTALFSGVITDFIFYEQTQAFFVVIYAFAIFSDYMLTLMNTLLRLQGKISYLAWNAIVISLIHHGLSFYVVVYLEGSVTNFISIFLITKITALILVAYHALKQKITLLDIASVKKLLIEMFQFGYPLILTALMGWVLLLSDRLFIHYYVTIADVGIYAVAYKFAMGLWIGVVQPFMIVWEPSLFKVFRKNPEQGYGKLKRDFAYYLAGIVLLYSAFILFIGEILPLLFAHSEYAHEQSIIYCLTGSYFLMAIGEMWAVVCRLNKTSRFAFYVSVAVLVTKIAFNITLIPTYLLIGAAVASVLAEIASQLVMGCFSARFLPASNIFFTGRNWLLVSLFCAAELLLYLFPEANLWQKSAFFLAELTVTFILFAKESKRAGFIWAFK